MSEAGTSDWPGVPDHFRAQKKKQAELFDRGEAIELAQEARPMLVASARGYGFRAAPDLTTTTRTGRKFAKVAAGDELVACEEINGSEVVCLASDGKGLRFALKDVAELSGVGRGVILMRVDPKEKMLGALSVTPSTKLVLDMGGDKTRPSAVGDFPKIKRGGKGNKVVKRGKASGFDRR